MSDDARIAEAHRMRADGALLREIADTFGVATSTALRWTKPGEMERSRASAREWKARNAERNRAAYNAYNADPKNRGRCLTCRGLMGVGHHQDGECRSCATARVHERALHIVEMWAQGDSGHEIAASLGFTEGYLSVEIGRLRRKGYSLPYRYRLAAPRHQHLAA